MKIVIAVDSFKESLASYEVADCIEKGIKKVYVDAEIIKVPIADGGEGTVDALVYGMGGRFVEVEVSNPLGERINSKYGILLDEKRAIIEMATASGLALVAPQKRNPLKTTTYGTGEMIKDAIKKGCRRFIVGIGGSATNDAGMGMMQALGMKFLDVHGQEVGEGGEALLKVAKIDGTKLLPELKMCQFLVACDVNNPLYGLNGAAYVYAGQKGANEEMIEELDAGLKHFSTVLKEYLSVDVSLVAGSGAAGGLGVAFLAFLNVELKSGIEIVLEEVQLQEKLDGADFVITGEGRMDAQSLMGKAPVGVAKLAKLEGVPIISLSGAIADNSEELLHKEGIDVLFSIMNAPMSLEEALNPEKTKVLVEKKTEEIFRLIKMVQNHNTLNG